MALALLLQLLTLWPPSHSSFTPSASHPRPWLEAQPAAIVTPGVNVTLRCLAPQLAGEFELFKLGERTPAYLRDVPSEVAEFFLEEVTPTQGGHYQCRYRGPDWGLDIWSQPSEALELLVTAAPAITGGAARASGGSRCQCEPEVCGPCAWHELCAVPRGHGGPTAVPRLGAVLGRLPAAQRPCPGHLLLLLPHALQALRAVPAQRASDHHLWGLRLLRLHPGERSASGAGRPRPPRPGHLAGHGQAGQEQHPWRPPTPGEPMKIWELKETSWREVEELGSLGA
ncbi:osteoclast-associated immunoglobulin-like receptor isoform X1 [Dipodomys merriami]|uniref:osteoclast-associated immunoglobulin-like receptor isoform X1 n=1 Tax=Dipodomys merriami TaxID=94247 RepID=UPI003855D0F2